MRDVRRDFLEGIGIEQLRDAFARRQLAALVLGVDAGLAAAETRRVAPAGNRDRSCDLTVEGSLVLRFLLWLGFALSALAENRLRFLDDLCPSTTVRSHGR